LIRVPKSKLEPSEENVVCAQFTVEYFNVLTTQIETLQVEVIIQRPAKVSKSLIPNETLDRQRNRIQVADAMSDARKKANEGKLTEAKKMLEQTKERVNGSSTAKDEFCQKLATELDECIQDMKSQEYYESEGSKKVSRKELAHHYQRSNKIEALECDFYETSSKFAYKEKSKSYK